LEEDCANISKSMNLTLPPILFVSCLLFAYIIFDTWGDELGWRSAILPTVLMAVIPFIMLISQVITINYRVHRAKRANSVYGLGRAATIGSGGAIGRSIIGGFYGKEELEDVREREKENGEETEEEEVITGLSSDGERERTKRKKRRATRIFQGRSGLLPVVPSTSTREETKVATQQQDEEDGGVSMITIVENPMIPLPVTSSSTDGGTLEIESERTNDHKE
jgi:hypothetical protein